MGKDKIVAPGGRSLDDIDETGVSWATEAEFGWLCDEVRGLLRERLAHNNPLANAGAGREACGCNHDELISSAVEEMRSEIDRLRGALVVYADRSNWAISSNRAGAMYRLFAADNGGYGPVHGWALAESALGVKP